MSTIIPSASMRCPHCGSRITSPDKNCYNWGKRTPQHVEAMGWFKH
ncbi:MAG: hypothetical protein QXU73_05830 [Thermoplasmata archaeon]